MRHIDLIIVHCSASRADINFGVQACRKYHMACRHYSDIGYHWYIEKDGSIHQGRPEEKVGAHCYGHNYNSIGVCYEGGLDKQAKPCDTRTPEQKLSLLSLLSELKQRFPGAKIVGHHDINPHKACPCFDARAEYSKL